MFARHYILLVARHYGSLVCQILRSQLLLPARNAAQELALGTCSLLSLINFGASPLSTSSSPSSSSPGRPDYHHHHHSTARNQFGKEDGEDAIEDG